jgi:hypothetical protein
MSTGKHVGESLLRRGNSKASFLYPVLLLLWPLQLYFAMYWHLSASDPKNAPNICSQCQREIFASHYQKLFDFVHG